MKDAPEVSWHVKFDSQNLKHSGDLARWSTIIAPHESSIEPKYNLATLGIKDFYLLKLVSTKSHDIHETILANFVVIMMRHTIASPAFFKIFDFLFGLRATLSSAGAPISTSAPMVISSSRKLYMLLATGPQCAHKLQMWVCQRAMMTNFNLVHVM